MLTLFEITKTFSHDQSCLDELHVSKEKRANSVMYPDSKEFTSSHNVSY
jgi:hypothetical protein